MEPRDRETVSYARPDDSETRPPGAGGEPAAADELGQGTTLGRYVVLYRVGRGGMGVVYAAYDPELDRKVALKVVRRDADSEAARNRMRREAQALAKLAHPNVVGVHDVGVEAGRLFIAMEYLAGETLTDWLAREARPWAEVVRVFCQAGRGLAAAHAAGLIHQDFKPINAMIGGDGQARVVDFGLARAGNDAGGPLAGGPPAAGTPAYLAPERLSGGAIDARSDQYSFCVALYRALVGELPPLATGSPPSAEGVAKAELQRLRTRAGLPRWLWRALLRGLRPRPEERFPTMAALLEALSPARRRARAGVLAAGGGGLVAAGLLLAIAWTRGPAAAGCRDPRSKLEGVWDGPRRAAVEATFLASEAPYAAAAGARFEAALDRYAAEWVAEYTDACEATRVRGEQSERLFDLRMLCLDGRLAELRALAHAVDRPDPGLLARAVEAAHELSGLAACRDREALLDLALPALDEAARRALGELRAEVEQLAMLLATGQPVDRLRAEAAAASARELGFPPLAGRALELLSRVQRNGDDRAHIETLRQALHAAVAGGDRPLTAQLFAQLAEGLASEPGSREEAGQWRDLAEAAVSSLGPGQEEVEIDARVKVGMYAIATGDSAGAERSLRQALALADRLWGPDDVRASSILNNLAILMGDRPDRSAEQRALLERVIDVRQRAYGPSHPRLAPPLTNLAFALALEGRYEAALASARRSLEVVRGEPVENHRQAYPLVLGGQVLLALDRPEEAVPDLERGLALVRERLHPHHPLAGRALLSLAEARIAQLRLVEARALLGQVGEIREGDLPSTHPLHTAHRLVSARLQIEEGDFAGGLSALRTLEEGAPADHLVPRDRLLIPVTLARAHLGLGQPGQAQALLEPALAAGRPEADATLFAEGRFLLARALEERQPERAVELARLALSGLRGESPRTGRLRSEMAAWLAANAEGAATPRRPRSS